MALLGLAVLAVALFGALALFRWLFGDTPEAKEAVRKNPGLNTYDWALHQERLQKYRNSKYRGRHYFYGPRGGLYYVNSNGHKTYC